MREWWAKLRAALQGRRGLSDDLHDEIEAHLGLVIQENIAEGMSPEKARESALRQFGNASLTRERAREAWSFAPVEVLLQEFRLAFRAVRRAGGFSLVVIATLALGIGANTAIFSVIDAVLLRPLPYPGAERLLRIGETNGKVQGFSVSWLNYQHWSQENHSFEEMAGFEWTSKTLTGVGEPVVARGTVVGSKFFDLTAARPELGRLFTESDDQKGSPDLALISHDFWVERMGSNPNIVGAIVSFDGKPFQVAGVVAPTYDFFGKPDFYVPLGQVHGGELKRNAHGSIRILARMKPNVTMAAAKADLDAIMQRLAQADPGSEDEHRAYPVPLAELSKHEIRSSLLVLMGAVGLVLAIACANVAGLVLARSSARMQEMAIRSAIGASRLRLIRQLLAEGLVLSTLGGICGVALAQWCLRTLVANGPRSIPRVTEITLNWAVLAFAAAITVLTGLLLGLAPVLITRKLDLVFALREGSISGARMRVGQGLRNALVVGEIGITLVLVFASALLIRSLIAAQNSPLGFAPDHLLAMHLNLPEGSYKNEAAIRNFYDGLAGDLRALPGVVAVGTTSCPPSSGGCGDWFYSIPGLPPPAQSDVPVAFTTVVDPSYFSTMQMTVREGRGFTEADRPGAPPVAVVNDAFARKWWPRESAVGHQIKYGGPYIEGPLYQIIGVVGNVSQMGLDAEAEPEMYTSALQAPHAAMAVMIRTSLDPEQLTPVVRSRVSAADKNLPIRRLQLFERTLAATLARRRFSTLLLALFAGLAMLLAAVGVYGLLAYWVSVREKEIAIRMALGAQQSTVLRWVGSRAMKLAAAGIVIGILGAWGATRWVESLVFGVSPLSPVTMAAAALVVLGITSMAAALPAWRAARVDPARKLHDA
jgi:putative ABC transport system permease protein